MKILRDLLPLSVCSLMVGCGGLVKIPGFTDLSDEEAEKRLYMAETYIELGAYGKAEQELSKFPKKSRHRDKVEVIRDRLNEFKVQPIDDMGYE